MSTQGIGKYTVEALLSRDARSKVYRALDRDSGRAVAVTVIGRPAVAAAALPSFARQAPTLARLEHPAIARFLELVENDKAVGVAAELCEGKSLAELLVAGAQPELRTAWDVARQLLEALACAHDHGVLHGDLGPGNAVLAPDGRLKVTGFALAPLFAAPPEVLNYRAPEQFAGAPAGTRTDLYQVGAVVYHLVTGRPPYSGTAAELAQRVPAGGAPDPSSFNSRIAWQLDFVIRKALSVNPAERFGSAREFAEGLRLGLQETVGRPLEPMRDAVAPRAAAAAAPPAAPAPLRKVAPMARPAPAPVEADTRPAVLFVDDDERILNALRALFRQDYRVATASGGAEALTLLATSPVDVIVSDQRMPGMTGVELLRQARAAAPAAARILLTGYTDLAALVGSINQGEIFRFVKKPWDNDELRQAIAEAVKLAQGAVTPAQAGAQSPESPRSAGSLLVIDPAEGLARGLERLLAGAARVRQVATPAEAAKVLATEEIAAIVADLGAGCDGLVALFRQVKAKRPEVLTILLADEPDSELGIELINKAQVFRFLPKPVSARELRTQVGLALRRYAAFKQKPAPSALAQDPGAPQLAVAGRA